MVFWIGSSVSPQILSDLFGVDEVNAVNPHMVRLFCIAVLPSDQRASMRYLSCRRHFLPRFTTSSINVFFNEDDLPKCSWLVRIWMRSKSSLVTCSLKIRIMALWLTLTVTTIVLILFYVLMSVLQFWRLFTSRFRLWLVFVCYVIRLALVDKHLAQQRRFILGQPWNARFTLVEP